MNTTRKFAWASVLLLFGCSPPPPAPSFSTALNLKQVMEWVVDPAADAIWDSVKSISTESGTKNIAPENDDEWAAVRHGAATLMESANLLLLPGRARDEQQWLANARNLVKAAESALKAAQAKDKDAVFAAGGDIYVVCKGCHQQYAPHLNSSRPGALFAAVSARHVNAGPAP
jgi:hypothetical protein